MSLKRTKVDSGARVDEVRVVVGADDVSRATVGFEVEVGGVKGGGVEADFLVELEVLLGPLEAVVPATNKLACLDGFDAG